MASAALAAHHPSPGGAAALPLAAANGPTGASSSAAQQQQNNGTAPSPALRLVEAHRGMALLREAVEKLAFLGSITPDVMQHRDELSKFVGEEISRTLVEQRRLEARYEELIAQRAALRGVVNKARYRELQAEVQAVSHALRQNTNQLCRNLKENPNISGNLLKIEKERGELMELLDRAMAELHASGTFNTIIARVEEDRAAQERLSLVIQQEKETAAAVQQVELELAREMESHKRTVAQQKGSIAHLKQELQAIKSRTAVETVYAKREAKAKAGSIQRVYFQEERDLEAQYRELRGKAETEQQVHEDLMGYLRDQQRELTERVEAWTNKMANDTARLDSLRDALTEKREAALVRLEAFRQRRRVELAQQKAREESEAKRLADEALMGILNRKRNRAAKIIKHAIRKYVNAKKAEEAKLAAKRAKAEAKAKGKKKK